MPQPPENRDEYDHWLARWEPVIKEAGCNVLEIGCGPGFDAEVLTAWGLMVTASDVSPEALAGSQQRNPGIRHVVADARSLAPFPEAGFDVAVASLSLHYFDEKESHAAFGAVHRVLRSGGVLVFRVNAHDDHEFGAPVRAKPWTVTDHHGRPKQFFTEPMLREVLAGRFQILSLEKRATFKYVKRKSVFECVAVRIG